MLGTHLKLGLMSLCAATVAMGAAAQDVADTIYTGGPVLTMDDSAPRAEALAVREGRIAAVGSLEAVMALRGESTRVIDLEGATLLPGFVDAHGHVAAIGLQAMAANLLPAPDGRGNSIAELQDILRDFIDAQPERVERFGAVIGFGYDDSQLSELAHPTRHDLDAVAADIPVYIVHQSGHLAVANTAALALAGITAESEEMPGGVIRREADGKTPDGVLEETPHFVALGRILGGLDAEGSIEMVRAGVDLVASYGYTTAQEGRASTGQVQMMQALAAQPDGLKVDVVAYPDILIDRDFILEEQSFDYENGLRVGGAKLTIDGSPQGFTAWRDKPYYAPPPQMRSDYVGYPAASPDQVFDAIDWAYENDVQILTHSNGEAASDLLLAATGAAAEKHGNDDRRSVLIHGQFLREDQVDRIKALDIFPSLFPMHTFYWGDWHRDRTVGPEAADNISPTGWVLKRGMRFSTHHDAPVAFPDSMRVLDATVTRRSRSGDIIGAAHRVDPMTALKAMTIWPAWQHFEENTKGSLEVGKLADLVVLSADPTAIDPETIDQIRVLRTIKEDEVVYDASERDEGSLLQWRPVPGRIDTGSEMLRRAALMREIPRDLSGVRRRVALRAGSGPTHGATCVSGYLFATLTPGFERAKDRLIP